MPGASEPVFTVPPGRMAVGLGIHGEPGIDETVVPSADALGELLCHVCFRRYQQESRYPVPAWCPF